ncbi:serine/threonine-protein kinase [Plantibacter sp. YIM 135249]|uniref:serine/threonine-protein kinase n=1 Tax=Plantibacter sp. YIM 135249 TaxID=3423918 RepID=UPI003D33CC31
MTETAPEPEAGAAEASAAGSARRTSDRAGRTGDRSGRYTGDHAAVPDGPDDLLGFVGSGESIEFAVGVGTEDASAPSLSNGRYRLGDRLGVGGTANVYRATDALLAREVAVKLFRDETATANDRLRQEREIRLLGELRHPGLVELYDSGSILHRGVEHRFLVMEYIPGATLADRLEEGPMLPRDAAALGSQLADALAFIHSKSIVHRDVKPENVLFSDVSAFGHANLAKLSDFGIAHFIGGSRLTNTDLLVGTASYLSPEQVNGGPIGAESDVYSLGLLLLEALTGRREFDGTVVEAAVARLHRDPVIPADLPAAWHPLLSSMTSRDPSQRPMAHEVATSLREIWSASRIRRGRRVRARSRAAADRGVPPRIATLIAVGSGVVGIVLGVVATLLFRG